MEKTRIPLPDYESHPGYGRCFPKVPLKKKLQAVGKLAPRFWQVLVKDVRLSLRSHPRPYEGTRQEAFEALRENGVFTFRLSDDEKVRLRALTLEAVAQVRKKRRKRNPKRLAVENSLVRLANPEDTETPIYRCISDILENLDIFALAKSYWGLDFRIHTVNLQINEATDGGIANVFPDLGLSPPPSYYAHMDTNVRSIKALIYLNEVTEENGPFRYVEGSHKADMSRFERCLRKASDLAGFDSTQPAARELFMALPSWLRRKANFGNDLLGETPETRHFFSRERLFTTQAGDFIVFDNHGIHRGAIFKSGERQMIQITLLPVRASAG